MLSVRRVFITDDCEGLNFSNGAVDTEDLPRSFETLQQNKTLRVIARNPVQKRPEMLADTAEKKDDSKKSYERSGKCLMLGVREDSTNPTKSAEPLRWHASRPRDEQIILKGYVNRMREGQSDIFYGTGGDLAAVSESPFFETLRKKGIEVRYMIDPIDEAPGVAQ